MNYNTSTRVSTADRAIAGLFVAGVMFILGYTVVRASLANSNQQAASPDTADVEVVVPGEGTLWSEFSTRY